VLTHPSGKNKDAARVGHPKLHPIASRRSRWTTEQGKETTQIMPKTGTKKKGIPDVLAIPFQSQEDGQNQLSAGGSVKV